MSSNIQKANTGNLIGSQVKSHQKFKISNNQLEKQSAPVGLDQKGSKELQSLVKFKCYNETSSQ